MTIKQITALLAPGTWPASIIPVVIGTLYSVYNVGYFRIDLFFALLLSAVGLQCFCNVTNDYFDFIDGTDTEETIYDQKGSVLVTDDIPLSQIKKLVAVIIIITSFPAFYLILQRGIVVIIISITGFLVALFYSAGPLPISKTFLGEFFSGFTMGGLITWLAYYIQSRSLNMNIVSISIPVILYIGSILLTNGLCDIEKDRNNRVTLPILIGRSRSIIILKFSYILMYLLVFLSVFRGLLPSSMLLIVLSLPIVWKNLRFIVPENISLKSRSAVMKNSVFSGVFFFSLYIFILLGEILSGGSLS